jgi:hypothetical protein
MNDVLRQRYAYTAFLTQFKFQLFATISLGVPYDPQQLTTTLRKVLRNVTATPYHCGFLGVYSTRKSPHCHLLLASASAPLDPRTVQTRLAAAFKRKDCSEHTIAIPQPVHSLGWGYLDFSEPIPDTNREFIGQSVNVQEITHLLGASNYMANHLPCELIEGNLKALKKSKFSPRESSNSSGSFAGRAGALPAHQTINYVPASFMVSGGIGGWGDPILSPLV